MKISIAIVLILFSLFFWYNGLKGPQHNEKAFYCDSQYIVDSNFENHKTRANISSTIIFPKKDNGVIFSSGNIEHDGVKYSVNRDNYYKVSQSELNDVSKVTILDGTVKPGDNVPNEIWQNIILPETPGITYYSKIRRVNDSLILIKTLTKPILICIRR